MGRFETSADFYHYREPYPPEFFQAVADRLALTASTRMLDVACGPGNLAIGFAPYVENCLAIDIEPAMLRVARESANAAATKIQFVQVAVEDLQADAHSFDFVTVGRALHWLPRDPTLSVLERVVAPGGAIAVCHSAASEVSAIGWTAKFREMRRAWSGDHDESRYRPDLDAWFAPSRFHKLAEISVQHHQVVTIEELIGRGLSFSVTSPAILGERRPEFEAALRAALTPFATNGSLNEELLIKAVVFS